MTSFFSRAISYDLFLQGGLRVLNIMYITNKKKKKKLNTGERKTPTTFIRGKSTNQSSTSLREYRVNARFKFESSEFRFDIKIPFLPRIILETVPLGFHSRLIWSRARDNWRRLCGSFFSEMHRETGAWKKK